MDPVVTGGMSDYKSRFVYGHCGDFNKPNNRIDSGAFLCVMARYYVGIIATFAK
jgi:hypothetical protein